MGLSVLVMDRLEGPCHVGQFLHATRTPQIPNASCAEAPWSRCGTAAPLGQCKSKGRAEVTWSLLTPSHPKLRRLLADPKKGPVHVRRSQEISHHDIQVCSCSPPLPAALGHVTRAQSRPDRLSGRLSGIVFSSLINGANSPPD